MLQCRLCQNGFKSIEDHCRHIELKHSVTSNPSLTCGFKTCTAKIRGVEKYHRHFKDFHDVSEEGNVASTDASLFKCAHSGCEYKAKSRSTREAIYFGSTHSPQHLMLIHLMELQITLVTVQLLFLILRIQLSHGVMNLFTSLKLHPFSKMNTRKMICLKS